MNLPPKDPLRDTRYAAFFVKPPEAGDAHKEHDEEEDQDELVLDEEDAVNDE